MKEITIGKHIFKWDVKLFYGADGCCHYETSFYLGTYIKTYKKYWLFGPIISEELPKFAFKVYFDITSLSITNEEVNILVMREYNHWIGMCEREENVLKGKYL